MVRATRSTGIVVGVAGVVEGLPRALGVDRVVAVAAVDGQRVAEAAGGVLDVDLAVPGGVAGDGVDELDPRGRVVAAEGEGVVAGCRR